MISRDEILDAIGMGRATTDYLPRMLVGFGFGMIVGAACALILAPKPGRELRTDLVDGANRLVQKGRDQIENVKGKFNDMADQRLQNAGV